MEKSEIKSVGGDFKILYEEERSSTMRAPQKELSGRNAEMFLRYALELATATKAAGIIGMINDIAQKLLPHDLETSNGAPTQGWISEGNGYVYYIDPQKGVQIEKVKASTN